MSSDARPALDGNVHERRVTTGPKVATPVVKVATEAVIWLGMRS